MPEQIKRFCTLFLVPGDGGSQVDAKLNKPSVVHYICEKQSSDYFNIWLNLELLVPIVIDCWVSFFLITLLFNFNELFKLHNCSLLFFFSVFQQIFKRKNEVFQWLITASEDPGVCYQC